MDSVNTREYRSRLARKIIKIKKELDEIDEQSANKWREHSIHVNHRFIKLNHDKDRLQAELRFMCRKIVIMNDEIIEALSIK